ncbi:NADH:flavin oxidoreductase [Desulfonema limicola]|uniref:NADH:flavin oxidoreductase n=1 Tax=Desulfonema limicola TaxID=45656 RepID=A0A975GIA8_9BACT|nr:NADH:flavin oxidoreductase [Desulfonema limicola]QTA81733.1 NADH:flavin oxidoreductase [Desulfonema limicola]
MSRLFEKTKINSMELSNRFVRSATWEGLAEEDGAVTQKLIDTMTTLAKGGVGMIITGHAYVSPEGQATPRQLGAYKDELVKGLGEMAGAVHDCGGKIVLQLAHAGNFAAEQIIKNTPLVPSNFEGLAKTPRREAADEDISNTVLAFANAAARAKSSGFDGVEIHSAHGYFLSQFLSPAFNRRNDEFGGDIKNRSRIVLDVYQAVRKAVGNDFPVMIKINCQDFEKNGLSLEDAVAVGKMLADEGLDAIELSGGLLTSMKLSPSRAGIKSQDKEAYFREEAKEFKKEIDIPLILVGGMRSFEVAEQMINNGTADYISMSRPLIREPDLIKRWKEGDLRKAECKSDNLCFKPGFEGSGIYCVTKEREEAK